jgi:carbon starvation protein
MSALLIAVVAVALFVLAYTVYGRFFGRRILDIDRDRATPAHELRDDIDYLPARRPVLFGHHFASIAGLGPILGPAIAVIWGWLPALIWIILGSIFCGAVHDFATLIISVRHRGRSIGTVAETLIGPRARTLFLLLIFFVLSLAMGVFALVIAILFGSEMYPEAVIPVFSLVFIAIVVGYLVTKRGAPLLPTSIIGFAVMTSTLWLGVRFPIVGPSQTAWVLVLLAYAFVASVLPVWLLLQPRDFLNSFQLILGMGITYLGLALLRPAIVAPAINRSAQDLPSIFPFLFITVACGAISGFHNLVSSGTTAKQLNSEGDAQFIGYGAMLVEGALGVIVLLACAAGAASAAKWHEHYVSWAAAGTLSQQLRAFVQGAAMFAAELGIPHEIGVTFISVVIVGFAMTTLDSATRLLRYNIEEMGHEFRIPPFRNRFLASLIAVAAIGYFALLKIGGRPAGLVLWQLFGTTNQLLAGLGLLVVTIYLYKSRKPTLFTLIPMLFMLATTGTAMVVKIGEFWREKAWAPFVLGLVLLALTVWLALEAYAAYRRASRMRGAVAPEPG